MALIKLFDRVYNIQTLGAKSSKKVIKATLIHGISFATYLEIPVLTHRLIELCNANLVISHFKPIQQNIFLDKHIFLLFLAFFSSL